MILLAFGAYTGYKFLPVELTKGKIEHGIDKAFEQISHRSTDEQVQANVARFVQTAGVNLVREDIRVEREQSPGQRVIHVDIYHPITVSYLGSDRAINKHIHKAKVIAVNEKAEAAYAEQKRREQYERDRQDSAERDFARRFKQTWAECVKKYGPAGCEVRYGPASNATRFGEVRRDF
jgi:hypothetical protein